MAKGKYEKWLEPENLILLEGWARDGLTDEQIAYNIGISRKTLAEWKKKYSDISDTLKKGKEIVDIQVENALLKKALGMKETVKKAIKVREVKYNDGKRVSEKEHIEYVDEEVFVPPDTTAQIFWLKNRKPDKWRDKVENVNTTDDDKVININICSTKGKTI
nr:MAG TPA: terminase small subunit [Bacteriophage sp.]